MWFKETHVPSSSSSSPLGEEDLVIPPPANQIEELTQPESGLHGNGTGTLVRLSDDVHLQVTTWANTLTLQFLAIFTPDRPLPPQVRLRLSFPCFSLVPSVTVHEDVENRALYVLLVSSDSLAYRLTFKDPTYFADIHLQPLSTWCERWKITSPGGKIARADSPNVDSIVCAREDGSLLVVRLPQSPAQPIEETELLQVSSLGRLVPGFLQSAKPNHGKYPVALRAFSHTLEDESESTFAFLLTADRKLVLWSINNKASKVYDLLDQNDTVSGFLASAPRNYMQLYFETIESLEVDAEGVPLNSTSHYKLALFLPLPEQSIFQTYRFTVDENQRGKLLDFTLEREVSSPVLPNEELVDFGIALKSNLLRDSVDSASHIWGVWEGLRKTTVAMASLVSRMKTSLLFLPWGGAETMLNIFLDHTAQGTLNGKGRGNSKWSFAVMSGREQEDVSDLSITLAFPGVDPQEAVLGHIFHPGRFSVRVILKSLESYGIRVHPEATTEEIKAKISEAVLSDLQANASPQAVSAEEFQQSLRVGWLNFLSHCVRNWQMSNSPLGIHISQNTHLLMLVKADSLSLIRQCDAAEVVHHFMERQLDSSLFSLLPAAALPDYPVLIPSETKEAILTFIGMVDAISESTSPISLHLTKVALSRLVTKALAPDFGYVFSKKFFHSHPALERKLRKFIRPDKDYLKNLLRTVAGVTRFFNDYSGANRLFFERTFLEGLAINLGQELVNSRFKVTEYLLLVALAFLPLVSREAEGPLQCFISEMVESYRVGLAAVQLHRQPFVRLHRHALLTKMKIFPAKEVAPATGFHANIYSAYFMEANKPALTQSFLAVPTMIMQGMIQELGYFAATREEGEAGLARTAALLDRYLQAPLLRSFIQGLPSKSAAIYHLTGKAFAFLGEYHKAEDCFSRAAVLAPSNLSVVISQRKDEGISERMYLELIATFFEELELSEFVITFAKKSLSSVSGTMDPQIAANLWSKLFYHQLELLRFDDAYLSMVTNPSEERKKDCMRRLITVLCEEGEFNKLCSLPFNNLQLELENNLEFKARNSPIDSKPNYYKVLYSYFVFKANFRKASAAMYRYAKRLATESPTFSLAAVGEETKAYLAAIHALSLVERRNAWIVGPVYERLTKKRRSTDVHADGEEDFMEVEGAKENENIKELNDIRQEYTLSLAKLVLVQYYPTFQEEAIPLDPADILSLLTDIGSYDTAFSFAQTFSFGLEKIFDNLAMKCVNNTGNEAALERREEIRPLVIWSDTMLSGSDGKESERMWKLLQRYLEKFDSEATQHRYRKLVVEKILSSERDVRLPTWILQPYKVQSGQSQPMASPSDLLKAYVKYDMIDEAYEYALSLIQSRVSSAYLGNSASFAKHQPWMPYPVFDQLMHILREKGALEQANELSERLKGLFNLMEEIAARAAAQEQ